jgi:Ca2+/Na+ antiporter
MKISSKLSSKLLVIFIFILVGLIGIRFLPFLFRLLPYALILGLLVYAFIVFSAYFSNHQQEEYDDKADKVIKEKLNYCREAIKKVHQERTTIMQEIEELEEKLNTALEIPQVTRTELERLIKEFNHELDLRNTKIEFYETCIQKLQALLHNHQLAQTLKHKQEKLKQLQEKNQEAIADFEALKTSVAFEQSYISTIDELSAKMLESKSLQDAKAVQLELEHITQELRQL